MKKVWVVCVVVVFVFFPLTPLYKVAQMNILNYLIIRSVNFEPQLSEIFECELLKLVKKSYCYTHVCIFFSFSFSLTLRNYTYY